MADGIPREAIRFRLLVRTCSLVAAGTGFVALLGWVLQLPFLTSFGSGKIPMAPSTALLFILYGIAAFLRTRLPLRGGAYRVGLVFNTAGTLIAVPLFFLSFLGIHSTFEHLGFPVTGTVGGAPIGHMSPVTALCFLLASLSFFALPPSFTDRSRRARAALYLASLLVATSFVLLLAYLFGTPLFYTGSFIPPAATTSLAFVALGIALLGLALPHARFLGRQGQQITRTEYVLLLGFLLLAVGIVTVGYLYTLNYERRYRNGVESQLSAIGELKVSELVQYRKERLGDAAVFFRNASFSGMVRRFLEQPKDAGARRQIRAWIGNYGAQYQSDRIFLLDARGVTRDSVPETPEPADPTISRRASEIAQSGRVAFQDFYRSEHNRKIYLAVLIPILDEQEDRRPLGVLVLRVDPEKYLYPLISRWPTPSRTAETLLVRRDGNDVLFLNELKFDKNSALTRRVPLDPSSKMPAVEAVLGKKGIVEGRDYRGKPVLADVREVPDSPWFVVARMDLSELYDPARERPWWMVSLVCVLLIAAGTGVGLAWRQQRVRFYRELEAIVSTNPDIIFRVDLNVNLIMWNRALEVVTGLATEALKNKPALELIVEEDRPSLVLSIQKCMEEGEGEAEARLFNAQGGSTLFHIKGVLLKDEDGSVVGITGSGRDITERKRSEEHLARLHQQNELILCSAAEGILGLDLQGYHTFVNPAAARMLGYEVEELLGRPSHSTWHHTKPDGSPYRVEECQICAAYRNGAVHRVSTEVFWSKDGTSFPVEYVSTPIYEQGRVAGAVLTFADITERKQSERELKESEEKFRVLFEDSKDGIILVDVESKKFHTGNHTFCDMLQYTLDEIRQLGISDIHPEEDVPWILEEFDRRARHETEKEIDIPVKRKDGSVFWADIKSSPVTISGKKYVFGNFRDVTERRKAEETLARLGMAVDQSAEAIVITDREGTIQYVNPAFERITGYSREEVVGKNPRILHSGKHDEIVLPGDVGNPPRGERSGGAFHQPEERWIALRGRRHDIPGPRFLGKYRKFRRREEGCHADYYRSRSR